MNFLWKLVLFCLWLGFHCSSGFVHNRHEIVKRDTKASSNEWRFPSDFLKTIMTPVVYIADKIDVDIPGLDNYRSDNNKE